MAGKVYTGPVVYIVHPMIGWETDSERVRKQEKYHPAQLRKLLKFAKEHDLPVLCEPFIGPEFQTLKKMVRDAGIKEGRFIRVPANLRDVLHLAKFVQGLKTKKERLAEFSANLSDLRQLNPARVDLSELSSLNPTRIIFGGALRGACVTTAITDMQWFWPNAKLILLKSSYSVKETKEFYDFSQKSPVADQRIARYAELKGDGVILTSKLGEHLLNPAWPLPARQREAKPNATRKRPAIVPRRALRSAAHRI
jgi:hypothetical protein